MSETLSDAQAVLLAVVCGMLFLLFDAARSLALQLGPMRMRRWSSDRPATRRRVFHYTPHNFSLITGTLVQISLLGGAAFTAIAMTDKGVVEAVSVSVLIWTVVVAGWKLILALFPDDLAEVALQGIIPVTRIVYFILWPLLFPIRWITDRATNRRDEDLEEEEVTDAEVQAYIDVGEEEGILEEGEGKLVQSIVDFGDRIARELMTPRVDMLAIEVGKSIEDLARLFSESKYSRIPVYEQNIDNIVGIIHIKDVFEALLKKGNKTLKELARPAYRVPETKKVFELLREFQVEHLQIAVVLDEFGGTAGLITIEDVIEEIVGEISDEHEDEEESILALEGGGYLINGHFRVERLEEIISAELHHEDDDYETVAGLIFTQMGRVPVVGDRVVKNGVVFEVDRADRKRIYRVRVMPEVLEPMERG
ncbi:MAG TPA: hemolysin family protein [Thermoanaerobaculia bacterium]|nr:hemolysin family protein [Thermoanaerobaculia bacterium]